MQTRLNEMGRRAARLFQQLHLPMPPPEWSQLPKIKKKNLDADLNNLPDHVLFKLDAKTLYTDTKQTRHFPTWGKSSNAQGKVPVNVPTDTLKFSGLGAQPEVASTWCTVLTLTLEGTLCRPHVPASLFALPQHAQNCVLLGFTR